MKSLENKIPPPILVLILMAAMSGAAKFLPAIEIAPGLHLALTMGLSLISMSFGLTGVVTFIRQRTTIDPVRIDRASHVVTGGIYHITRNPMYVGLTGLLTMWAVHLAVPWTLAGPIAFALFMHFFQILPEERAMEARFGREYLDYQKKVRRWL